MRCLKRSNLKRREKQRYEADSLIFIKNKDRLNKISYFGPGARSLRVDIFKPFFFEIISYILHVQQEGFQ